MIPTPDPAPNTGNRPVQMVAYKTVLPAVWRRGPHKGERIPHWFFRCEVPVTGPRLCVIFKR